MSIIKLNLLSQSINYTFERLEADRGFPMGAMNEVMQDSRGFIWAGGLPGLIRYDGSKVVHFVNNAMDSFSIGDSRINVIMESKIQNGLWISTQKGLNFYNRYNNTFTRYLKESERHSEYKSRIVNNMCQLASGDLLLQIGSNLIVIFDPETKKLTSVNSSIVQSWINAFHIRNDGFILAGDNKGLYTINVENKKVEKATILNNKDSITIDEPVYSICEDKDGVIWLGSYNSIIKYDIAKEKLTKYKVPQIGNFYFGCILSSKDGIIWIGSNQGLFRFSPNSLRWDQYKHDSDNIRTLSSNSINKIFEDRTGNIWISTVAGLNILRPTTEVFYKYPNNYQYEMPNVGSLRSFYELDTGQILIWKKRGLSIWYWKEDSEELFPKIPDNLTAWNSGVYSYFRDNEARLWFGTHRGLFMYNQNLKQFTWFHKDSGDKLALSGNFIRSINQDHQGNIWIALWSGGINMLNLKKNECTHFFSSQDDIITNQISGRKVFVDREGVVWAGTRGGLNKYDSIKSQFIRYFHNPDDPSSMGENTAFDIYEDESGYLWIGTYGGGLNRFDKKNETFKRYSKNEGLPDNNVFSVFPDDNGNLWLSTYVGIVKFNIAKETFKTFDYRDGLLNKQYDGFSHFKSPYTGHFFYEGKQGIDVFHPDSIKTDTVLPEVRITDFQLYNRNIPVSKENKALKRNDYFLNSSISETSKIVLSYERSRVISFEFAAMHFSNPDKNQYAYFLEGFDREMQYIGNRRSVTFTNLSPGKYKLYLYAGNPDGIWNKKGTALVLNIKPPWWKTWWAYSIYLSTIFYVIWRFHIFQKNKTIRQEREKAKDRELEQAKEIEIAYTKLKTTQAQLIHAEKMASLGELTAGIAHEIQNPLNFVNNFSEINSELLDEVDIELEEGNLDEVKILLTDLKENEKKINHHGKRADNIVKGMLEHSRVSAGKREKTNINALLEEYLKLSFHGMRAKDKTFQCEFESDFDENLPLLSVVPQDLGRVFLNLINNAFQAAHEKKLKWASKEDQEDRIDYRPLVSVFTELTSNNIKIRITDNGSGIPENNIDKIFQPFFTTKPTGQGTGLGLSLSYDIIKAHEGEIMVESNIGTGSTFTINLPVPN